VRFDDIIHSSRVEQQIGAWRGCGAWTSFGTILVPRWWHRIQLHNCTITQELCALPLLAPTSLIATLLIFDIPPCPSPHPCLGPSRVVANCGLGAPVSPGVAPGRHGVSLTPGVAVLLGRCAHVGQG